MVEPIRIKDQFSLISGTKSIQDDTNIVADDDGGADSDIADPDDEEEDPDDPDAVGDYEVRVLLSTWVNFYLKIFKNVYKSIPIPFIRVGEDTFEIYLRYRYIRTAIFGIF